VYSQKERDQFQDVIYKGCLAKQSLDETNASILPAVIDESCKCFASKATADVFGSIEYQVALSRKDDEAAQRIISQVVSSEATTSTRMRACLQVSVDRRGGLSKVVTTVPDVQLSTKIGLTGEIRRGYITGGIQTCKDSLRQMPAYKDTTDDLIEAYCNCAMNYSADRISPATMVELLKQAPSAVKSLLELSKESGYFCLKKLFGSEPTASGTGFVGSSQGHVPEANTPVPQVSQSGERSDKLEYERLLGLFRDGDLDGARQGFAAFLRDRPNSDLSPNARYWLGESHYGKKDYRQAIDSYDRVELDFPQSEKVPAAILKKGYAYLAMKDKKRASSAFKQVVTLYPESPEAGKASDKLAQLKESDPVPPKIEDAKKDATPTSTGTGFIISRQGHVLTNHHMVEGCTTIRAVTEGRNNELTVVGADAENDLAVLKLPAPASSMARFRDGRSIRSGDGVVVVGFPLHGLLASEANVTTGTVSALAGIGNNTRFLQITAPVQPGNSGGPLLDQSGNIVGVVVSKLNALKLAKATGDIPQNINFAIKSAVAKSFLDSHSVEYETGASTKKLESAEIGAAAKKFTLLVECYR